MRMTHSKGWTLVTLLFMILELVTVTQADYIIQVRAYSYNNPTESCALCIGTDGVSDISPRCCDSSETTCIGLVTHCDTFYTYCLRPLGTNTTSGCTGLVISDINENDAPLDFSQPSVLGLSNPLTLRGSTAEWSGVQLFIEVTDRDPLNGFDDIIDRFFIDITPADYPLGEESPRTNYRGMFTLADMELSFRVDCAQNFVGSNCSECAAGYTGPFCKTEIDMCEGNNCSGHGECEGGRNSFTCTCEPGFSGELCEIDTKSIWERLHFGVYVGIGAGLVVVIMIVLLVLAVVVVLVKNNKRRKNKMKKRKETDDAYYTEPEFFKVQNKAYNFTYHPPEDKKTTSTLFPPLNQEEERYSGIYDVVT